MRSSEIFSWFFCIKYRFFEIELPFSFFCSNWMFSRNSLRALVFKTLFTCLISINSIKINRLFIFVYDITRQAAMLEDSVSVSKKEAYSYPCDIFPIPRVFWQMRVTLCYVVWTFSILDFPKKSRYIFCLNFKCPIM